MTFWSGEKLGERLPDLITPFDASKLDCAAYKMTIGEEAYVTPPGGDEEVNTRTKQQLPARGALIIPPGQFGFLLTEEIVRVPPDVIGFISIRARVKSRGLVNVSGFHVDPGYNGRLIFAVFNAGPAPIHLHRGDDCFLIWFADLDRTSRSVKTGVGFTDLPSDLINPIAGEVQSLDGLLAKIKDNKEDVEERLSKIERDHAVLKWGVGLIVLATVAWFGREFLPARSSTQPSPPAITAPGPGTPSTP